MVRGIIPTHQSMNVLMIGSKDNIPQYIEKAKDKNDPFRLMGFGHRVYKNYDPRATIIAPVNVARSTIKLGLNFSSV